MHSGRVTIIPLGCHKERGGIYTFPERPRFKVPCHETTFPDRSEYMLVVPLNASGQCYLHHSRDAGCYDGTAR